MVDLVHTEIVRPVHSRPIGPPGRCTYCRELVGARHRADCVCVLKTVVVRWTIDVVSAEPRSHDNAITEFYLSAEGSHCADNTIERLYEWVKRREASGRGCSCGAVVSAEVIREATEQDAEYLPTLYDPDTVGE